MAVDKDLFLYDLAVVAIMKNEAPYVKEWLDYHILAGVDHFYIYDNESPDNLKEILQPYINSGIVTHIFYPGKVMQCSAYNDAVKKYKFFCRYIAFIDGDEFIFPQNQRTINEILEEIFSKNPNASGLAINWQLYGSNFQDKADYSKGVLERFTRRGPKDSGPMMPGEKNNNCFTKTITNPRTVDFFQDPHYAVYYVGKYKINEDGKILPPNSFNYPITVKKICINHYVLKSREEYEKKISRGDAYFMKNPRSENDIAFKGLYNDEFDDSILKYRIARIQQGGIVHSINYQKCYNSLMRNLSPIFVKQVPKNILVGKMETFLTCWKLSGYLREKILDEDVGNLFEMLSLRAVYQTLFTNIGIADLKLLFSVLPEILKLDYPVIKDIHKACINFIPQLREFYRVNNSYREIIELEYLLNTLKVLNGDNPA